MNTPFVSRFTPSLMDASTLETIFVKREPIAKRIVTSLRTSLTTPTKQHTLLIGPRGIGKTHLISLIYHRIKAITGLKSHTVVAWLREEEWGVTSFLDLLLRILRAIGESTRDSELIARTEELFDQAPDVAERVASRLIEEALKGRTLFLIMENLDDLFAGLGELGQQRLRSHIQEHQTWTLLASAQGLFNGVALQTSPFYGFFRIVHLQELDTEDAIQLLANIAQADGRADLAAFVRTPQGRARIRAIHHLAGGNPRVYVILSQFLSRTSLDTLVEVFLRAMDDLTPYYQARMQWLSPQQRKLVEYLVHRRGAAPVKEIAQRNFMTPQTASSQLKTLREMGYVQAQSVGRESYYELREPLMRFALELKTQRGEPIKLFVDFLRVWYSRQELQAHLAQLTPERKLDRRYLTKALSDLPLDSDDPRVNACASDLNKFLKMEDWSRALFAAEELTVLRDSEADWRARAECLDKLQRFQEAADVVQVLTTKDPTNTYYWFRLGWLQRQSGDHVRALASFDRMIELDPADGDGWYWRGSTLEDLERAEEGLSAFDRAVELDGRDPYNWSGRAFVLYGLGRYEEALLSIERAREIAPEDAGFWTGQAVVLVALEKYSEAASAYEKAIELKPGDPLVRLRAAQLLEAMGRREDAVKLLMEAATLKSDNSPMWLELGRALVAIQRFEEALVAFDAAGKLTGDSSGVFFGRAESLFGLGRWEEGLKLLRRAMRQSGEPQAEGHPPAPILHALLSTGERQAEWKKYISAIARLYTEAGQLSELTAGIILTAQQIMKDGHTAANSWLEAWRTASPLLENRDELELPLRILSAAVEFKESGSRRALLQLPLEERKLLDSQMSNLHGK